MLDVRLRGIGLLATFVVGLLAASPAQATHRNCNATERTTADAQLWLNTRDKRLSMETHLPWGEPVPTSPVSNERYLVQRDYVIRYDDDLRAPLWTAERVDGSRLGVAHRTDCFRRDPRISPIDVASTPTDFSEPIYDQGHISAFANQDTSVIAGNNSFVMSNMAPQTCQFNRGIWQILEGITRLWAKEHTTIWVFNGSVFDRDGNGRRDADSAAERMRSNNGNRRVAVASAFFKVIARKQPNGRLATLTILMPHDTANPNGPAATAYLRSHIKRIVDVERLAGIDLFPGVTTIDESTTLWPINGEQPGTLCFE